MGQKMTQINQRERGRGKEKEEEEGNGGNDGKRGDGGRQHPERESV